MEKTEQQRSGLKGYPAWSITLDGNIECWFARGPYGLIGGFSNENVCLAVLAADIRFYEAKWTWTKQFASQTYKQMLRDILQAYDQTVKDALAGFDRDIAFRLANEDLDKLVMSRTEFTAEALPPENGIIIHELTGPNPDSKRRYVLVASNRLIEGLCFSEWEDVNKHIANKIVWPEPTFP